MRDRQQVSPSAHLKQITETLYKNAGGAISGSVINIALVAYVLSDIYPTFSLLSWFALGQLLNFIRWFMVLQHSNDSQKYPTHIWLRIHRVLTLLSGAMYGFLAIFFFNTESPLYQVLVILLVGGMGAAAVGTHGVDKFTFRVFILTAVIPLIGRCICEDTVVHATMALMLCLLVVIMIKAANQTQAIMLENFQMSESLRYRATHDGLVGLLNREEFERSYNENVNRPREDGNTLTSIIFIDLDNFKKLNDTLGHLEGDRALIEISEIIRHSVRKTDIAARFGGDEFMILLQSDSLEEPDAVAKKVLERINQYKTSLDKHIEPSLGASIGIGYAASERDITFSELLKAADQACYKAKTSGKGKIHHEQVV